MEKCKELLSIIAEFYKSHGRKLPWRENKDPYRVWLSEIMLQQTRVEAVIPYFHRFLSAFPDVHALAEASEQEVLKMWEGLGYYSRARNLHRAAKAIVEQHGGVFPARYEELLALPGVGEYTAAAVGSICFGLPRAAVDGNVLRIWARVFADSRPITDAAVKKEITATLSAAYPSGDAAEGATQGFMEIGQRFCLPNGTPLCAECPLRQICEANGKGECTSYPVRAAKATRKIQQKTVLLLHVASADVEKGYFLIRKRPENGLLGGLWEFPLFDGTLTEAQAFAAAESIGVHPIAVLQTAGGKHIFTHVEWHMTGMLLECEEIIPEGLTAASVSDLRDRYPIASAFRAFKEPILNG